MLKYGSNISFYYLYFPTGPLLQTNLCLERTISNYHILGMAPTITLFHPAGIHDCRNLWTISISQARHSYLGKHGSTAAKAWFSQECFKVHLIGQSRNLFRKFWRVNSGLRAFFSPSTSILVFLLGKEEVRQVAKLGISPIVTAHMDCTFPAVLWQSWFFPSLCRWKYLLQHNEVSQLSALFP